MYRRHYERLLRSGLVLAVWFAACARAADDLWAASLVFAWATALACAFCLGRALDKKPVKLPLLLPGALFLAGAALSFAGSYDRNATLFEAWIWAFSFLLALLFVNVVETAAELETTLTAFGVALVPLAVELASKLALGSELGGELRQGLVVPNFAAQLAIAGLLLGLFYAALYYLLRVVERKDALRVLGLLAALAGLHAALLLFTERRMPNEMETPLINHNVLVGFALYWFFVLWKKTLERAAWFALLFPCCFILMLERSWWSYVVLLIGFLFYYQAHLAEKFRKHQAVFARVAGAALAILAILIAIKVSQRSQSVVGVGRLLWWAAAARMLLRHPLTGVGLGGFAAAYPFFKVGVVDNTIHAHSFPLQLLAETGAFGAAAAIYLARSYCRLLAGADRNDGPRRAARATIVSVLCFAAIHINLEYFLNKFVLLFFLASLLIGRDVPARRIKPLFLACAGGCLLLLCPFWLKLYASSRLLIAGRAAQEGGDRARAEELYKEALSVDPTDADCDWALSALALEKFKETASPQARLEAENYLRDGLRQKKDFFALKSLTNPSPP